MEAPASPRYEMKPHAPWPTGQPLHPRPLSEPDTPLIRVLDPSTSTMLCSTGLRLHRALQHRFTHEMGARPQHRRDSVPPPPTPAAIIRCGTSSEVPVSKAPTVPPHAPPARACGRARNASTLHPAVRAHAVTPASDRRCASAPSASPGSPQTLATRYRSAASKPWFHRVFPASHAQRWWRALQHRQAAEPHKEPHARSPRMRRTLQQRQIHHCR